MIRRLVPFAAELVTHRDLLWQFTLRTVEMRYKGSHLGLLWSFVNPLLMVGLYIFVFSFIFGGSFGSVPHETRYDYALGMLVGFTVFGFVAETVGTSATAIVGNPNFVKRVVFPLEILPAANVGAAGIHTLVNVGLIVAGALFLGDGLRLTSLWIVAILIPIALLALGLAWGLAAIGVFFRDLAPMLQFITQAFMFASGIFYSPSRIPPQAWEFLRFNPLLQAIDLSRDVLLWHHPIRLMPLLYLYLVGGTVCYLGYWCFRKLRNGFADVL